jgi:hypothetical protein
MDESDSLVSSELAEQLERACRTSVGDSLRSITYFTADAYQQVYLRSDLESDADLTGFVEQAMDGFHAKTAYRGSELGDYRYTMRVFEKGYLVRVTGNGAGVFVTTDGMTIQRGTEVASALRGVLTGAETDAPA